MDIPRALTEHIRDKLLNDRKVIVLLGPRQVGKTTLSHKLIEALALKTLELNADELPDLNALSSRDANQLKLLIGDYELLFIDEAQRIPDIGINLKILHDRFPDLRIIVTGSSSFELANRVQEPLTGRTWTYNLFPIAISELRELKSPFEIHRDLDTYLRFGMYPDVLNRTSAVDKEALLNEISQAYLYKDILELGGIQHPNKIRDLLRLLAFQIGSTVSFSEIGKHLGLSTETVQRYKDLLTKSFVLFELSGFSKNLRKEVTRNNKYYFYDLGIRNAIIGNFNPPDKREDIGGMWENFLIIERLKNLHYQRIFANTYFWRTYTGAELDYVEEYGGTLKGVEFKWGKKKAKAPKTWLETYSESEFECINRDNYLSWLL